MPSPFPFHGVNENLKPHLQLILDGLEYAVHDVKFPYQPVILDIGANVGAYSYWMLSQLPGAFIYAYEPSLDNVDAYKKNMLEAFGPGNQQWRIFRGCVSAAPTDTINLYLSSVNAGMHSVIPEMTNTPCAEVIEVPNYHPNRLPNCDILKLDTEGCELEILKNYLPTHIAPSVISLEFHSRQDYYEIDRLLSHNYIPSTGHILHPDLGTINYVHNNQCKPNVA